MKKFVAALQVGFCLLCVEAQAAGPYDGIWITTYFGTLAGYYSVHENNGTLVAISVRGDNALWEAYAGPRNGNTANLSTIVSGVNASYTVTLTTETTFIATQTSCLPRLAGWHCLYPNGTTVQGVKIW